MEPTSQFFPALQELYLAHHQVQVWQAWLDRPSQAMSAYFDLLHADEKVRAGRFYFEEDRNYYIVCRGLLRLLLGAYLDIRPGQVEFCYGRHGKPAIRTGSRAQDQLEFNVSHSKGMGIFAFCWENPIGIDVEYQHPMPDEDSFAREFFSPTESAFISSLSGAQKLEAFFKLWTCKEAFVKANGGGLTEPVDQIEVLLAEGEPARLVSIDRDPAQAARWRLETFEPASGYQAALVVEGHNWQIEYPQLSESNPKGF